MFLGESVATRLARRGALFVFVFFASMLAAAFQPRLHAENAPVLPHPGGDDLPAYDFRYTNGLYATIAGFVSIKEPELKSQKSYKLKVDNFKNKFPVKAIVQRETAPLVVVLLGIDGKADGALGKLWPAWYAEAGYHVLTFDSTFLPTFTEYSGRGVTGNLVAESEAVRDIIKAFLEQTDVKGRVSKLGIVGMSYGGIEALVLGKMAKENALPFNVDAIQSYSAPLNLRATGEVIDKWFAEDRWDYTLVELAGKLQGHKPVGPDDPVPFTDSVMRAGIAAIFRLGLVDVIVRNDKMYKLNVLPRGNNFDDDYVKRDYASVMGYTAFMNELSFPYWQKKSNLQQLSDLTSPVEVINLLDKQPSFSQLVIAEDDPLNSAEDLSTLKAKYAEPSLLLLPHGGHLGYVNTPWVKAKLLSIFKSSRNSSAAMK